jgi:DNA processing protein
LKKTIYERLARTEGATPRRVAKLTDQNWSLEAIDAFFKGRIRGRPATDPFCTPACDIYPEKLKHLTDPPLRLFYRGKPIDGLSPSVVAVVGSRKATRYGLSSARRLGATLARHGVSVCSGLARGIDGAVHRGVLDELKRNPEAATPVGVLGHGWGQLHPPENRDLFQDLLKEGVLLTEYERDTPPSRWTFPARNRIIASLSDHVVVVEAGERSGSLHTANFASELHREVWVVPSSPGRPNSAGVLNLLSKDGAKMIVNFDEFVHEVAPKPTRAKRNDLSPLPQETRRILLELARAEGQLDALCEALDWSSTELAYRLTELELEGLVRRNLEGNYDLLCWDQLSQLETAISPSSSEGGPIVV